MLKYLFGLLWKDLPVVVRLGYVGLPLLGVGAAKFMINGGYTLSQSELVTSCALLLLAIWVAARAVWHGYTLAKAAEPKMQLVQIMERRNSQLGYGKTGQTFTLKVKNSGSVPFTYCVAKVDDMAGSHLHESRPLCTYRSGERGISAFMLKRGETEEIFLTENHVTAGDTFVTAKVMYESTPERWIDPDAESEMVVGLYCDGSDPTFVHLKLVRNAKGFLEITEA